MIFQIIGVWITWVQLYFVGGILEQIVWSTDKIDSEYFPKVIVLKHSTKIAMSSSFRRAAYQSFSISKTQIFFFFDF